MTIFIQSIVLVISIVFIILVVKWQVDDDIKEIKKRLDKVHKEINNKKKTMSKDITKDILLKAGFMDASDNAFKFFIDGGYIILQYIIQPFGRCWTCYVDTTINMCKADIQTVEHFNKLMEIMNINFRLEEE